MKNLNRASVILASVTWLLVASMTFFKYQELREWSSLSLISQREHQVGSAPFGVSRENADGQVMKVRAKYLRQACEKPEIRQIAPPRPWTKKRVILHPLPLCVAPKGGSITWRTFLRELSYHVPGTRQDLKTLVSRHPLSRLASVYRDKYLNGSPLMAYNRTFKKITGSTQTWRGRWVKYWLPALIHKGLIKPSPKFLKVINEASEAFKFVVKHINVSGHVNLNTSSKEVSSFTPSMLDLAKRMLLNGRNVGMVAAINAGYRGRENNKFQRLFRNSSFSFVEFLEHVLWTWDLGLVDSHWTPVCELCDPCGANYSYILHLENPTESAYLLSLLQTQNISLPKRHKSIGSPKNYSDLWYFKDVPEELMSKIHKLYRGDFDLFGYDENHI
ncbi:uncharacterized protein [Panulirus ornatus]|uniref:uncharacterized protein isoform X2 n=1 Tax=Panulirus ornatus TaxID=150431 RepID=UPI003A83B990